MPGSKESKQGRTKVDAISLRIEPRTRFLLDLVSRVTGQKNTTVIERAIESAADKIDLGGFVWRDLWDADEGVRQLRVLLCGMFSLDPEEEELAQFIRQHWSFFSSVPFDRPAAIEGLSADRIHVLWPYLHDLLKLWKAT